MSYLPQIAWSTVINDVVMTSTTTYVITISALNPNEPGGNVGDVAIGYYLKDFVGNVYDITGINVGGNASRIEVTDPTDIPSGYGPQTGQVAFIYNSPQNNEAPYLAPVRNNRLDQSALDYSRSVEMDIAWKNRGFRESTSNHDNITTLGLGDNISYTVTHDIGWNGGNKIEINVADIISFSGNAGYLTKFTGNPVDSLADSPMYTDGTGVAIGYTSLSSYALKISGDGYFSSSITSPTINLTSGATVGYFWQCTNATTGAGEWAAITSGLSYNGAWDANTNTPTLANGIGTAGTYYHCTVSGTVDFGAGNISFIEYVDDVAYNGTIWEKIPNAQYQLLTMTSSVLGGAKVGGSLQINSAVLDIANADMGDITVSGTGASTGKIWTIDNGVVTLAKMANMATASLIYRRSAGTGAPEVNTLAQLKTDLNIVAGTGTVTSVDMTVPTGLTIGGNPITTSGTLALSLTSGYHFLTSAQISAWNALVTFPGFGTSHATAAYGDHNHSGVYLTSETSHADVVVDGDFTSQGIMLRGASSGVYSILTNSSADWNTAFGWGNWASNFGSTIGKICQGNDARLSDARTPLSHVHGNITNAGAIGTTTGLPIITTTSGVLTVGSFGSSAGTFCVGNDSRLSDARVSNIAAGTSGNVMTSNGSVWTSAAIPNSHVATSVNTTTGLSIIGQQIFLATSNGSTIGALSAADWTTFNAKQPLITTSSWIKMSYAEGQSGLIIGDYSSGAYTLLYDGATGANLVAFPNKSGTVAMLSDIPAITNATIRAAISLTTNGTSGASTYTEATGVFNIPVYSGGSGGITSLNGLTGTSQTFAVGVTSTAPSWSSATTTHTLHIPMASTALVTAGLLSKADYDVFNGKQPQLNGTGFVKASGATISYDNSTYSVSTHSHSTYVVGPASATDTAVAIYDGITGKLIKNSGVTINGSNVISAANFQLSDRRLKINIEPISDLDKFDKIDMCQFLMKDDETKRLRFGVIAQDIYKIAPELVYKDTSGRLSVSYIDLLIGKIARMEEIIKELERRIENGST